jgi:outer membrane protein TolC
MDLLPLPTAGESYADLSLGSAYVRFALQNRADLAAIQQNRLALEILATAAQRNLKPRLDFNVRLGYAGFNEGSSLISPITNNLEGVNVQGGLSMDWPVENRLRRGIFSQRLASEARVRYQAAQLDQVIAREVLSALEAVEKRSREVVASQAAADAYLRAAELERKRFGVGDASLLDILQLEDSYLESRLSTIQAQSRLAIAVGRLRFVLGDVFKAIDTENQAYTLQDLTDPALPSTAR